VSKGCLSSARVACACGVRAFENLAVSTHVQIGPLRALSARHAVQHFNVQTKSDRTVESTGFYSKLSRFPTLRKPFEPTTRCPELVQSCPAHARRDSPLTSGAIKPGNGNGILSTGSLARSTGGENRRGSDMRIVRDRPRHVQSVRRGRPRQTHTSGGCLQMPYQQNAPSPKLRWMRLEPHTE
jgi:hypothetical protein